MPPFGDNIGESWELSPMDDRESIVDHGPFEGCKLSELASRYPTQLCGRISVERYGHRFPLLIKWLDTNADLSIQVHPDGALSSRRHNANGKTEMWYCVDAASDAYLYNGFNTPMTHERLISAIDQHAIVSLLGKFHPRKGDVFFLPAGRIHSLGPGNLMLEIQEASDITYRIYDYNRLDADGKPRQLHIEESLEALDLSVPENCVGHVDPRPGEEVFMQQCPLFTVTLINPVAPTRLDLSHRESFTILTAVDGDATLTDPEGNTTCLKQGHTALIPASMPDVSIVPGQGSCQIVTVYMS